MTTFAHRHVAFAIAAVFVFSTHLALAEIEVSGTNDGVNLGNLPADTQSIRLTGPDGFAVVTDDGFVSSSDGGRLSDGVYRYELKVSEWRPVDSRLRDRAMRDNAANGRDSAAQPTAFREVVAEQGSFMIRGGRVVVRTDEVEE